MNGHTCIVTSGTYWYGSRSLFAFGTFLVPTLWQFPKRTSGGFCSRLLARMIVLEEEGTACEGVKERTGCVWKWICIFYCVSYQYNSTVQPKKVKIRRLVFSRRRRRTRMLQISLEADSPPEEDALEDSGNRKSDSILVR